MPNSLANILIERNRVAETCAAWVRRSRQETIIRRMPAIHVRMRHTAEHSKITPILLQCLEIRRQRVVTAAVLGKELVWQQTKIIANAEHAARLSARRGIRCEPPLGHTSKSRRHGIQQRQRQQDSRPA